ncbi:MAG: hypothetical protein WCT37_02590 [Patescibacteria group bacterium]|jgi:hypothetical protein
MTPYRQILKNAWLTIRSRRGLWFFGFLATFWGVGGVYEIILNGLRLSTGRDFFLVKLWQSIAVTGISGADLKAAFFVRPLTGLTLIMMLLIIALIVLFFYWLFTTSQITVLRACAKGPGRDSALAGFAESQKYFWPVFVLNLGGKILIFFIFFLLSYGALAAVLNGGVTILGFSFYLVTFIVSLLLVLTISFLVLLSNIYLTVKDYRLKDAVAAAWRLLFANWLILLEVAAGLFALTILITIALFLVVLMLMAPLYVLSYASIVLQSPWLYYLSYLAVIIIIFLLALVVTAGLTTFQLAVWVGVFGNLEKNQLESKLHRLTADKLNNT